MSLVPIVVIKIAFAILGISAVLFIAWAVIYADKLAERRFVAEERAKEARRKAARSRALDAWEQQRLRRLSQLGVPREHDPWEEESASQRHPSTIEEPPSQDEGTVS